jgi:xylulokinase
MDPTFLLGYDIGSSTIKASLLAADSRKVLAVVQYPEQDMDMISRKKGWAEQQPELWWQHTCMATRKLLAQTGVNSKDIAAIGIGYQMHGLVLIDKDLQVLRPSIIWCDSRAVPIGDEAFDGIGQSHCLNNYLNSPGNFTASKLKWIKDNEPDVFDRIYKILLPGDFIAMRLTGEVNSTISGLTEGVFWNFRTREVASDLLEYFGINPEVLPETVPTFSIQGKVSKEASEMTGLAKGTPITYRAGDQPNNALSLNVLHPGEVAATSGTSGVVYAIVNKLLYDRESGVNAFAHVNYEENYDRIGTLLCINGAGIQYSWIKHQIARGSHSYDDMERMAASVPIGSGGICLLPFGNGAERIFHNKNIGSHIFNMQHNRHSRADLYRASLEGVAFSFVYGINILKEMGHSVDLIRVGNDNMFQSRIFSTTISTMLGNQIEVIDTTGATGAAKAAGVAVGIYRNLEEALEEITPSIVYDPELDQGLVQRAYNYWTSRLNTVLNTEVPEEEKTANLKEELDESKSSLKKKNTKIASLTLQLESQKKELDEIKNLILSMDQGNVESEKRSEILRKLQAISPSKHNWQTFEQHFDLLNDDFLKRMRSLHPDLGIEDLKLCALLRTRLSTKDISRRINLSPRGVESRRYRLRKKLGLAKTTSLLSYLDQI